MTSELRRSYGQPPLFLNKEASTLPTSRRARHLFRHEMRVERADRGIPVNNSPLAGAGQLWRAAARGRLDRHKTREYIFKSAVAAITRPCCTRSAGLGRRAPAIPRPFIILFIHQLQLKPPLIISGKPAVRPLLHVLNIYLHMKQRCWTPLLGRCVCPCSQRSGHNSRTFFTTSQLIHLNQTHSCRSLLYSI